MEILLPTEPETVRITEVKGHADVEQGRVLAEDRLGDNEADAAAELERRHQPEEVMDVRRALINVRVLWCSIMLQLRQLTIAISQVSVNHDGSGGIAPDPFVWHQGGRAEQRKVDIQVAVDFTTLLGPPGFLDGWWFQVDGGLSSLHWPADSRDLASWGFLFGRFDFV